MRKARHTRRQSLAARRGALAIAVAALLASALGAGAAALAAGGASVLVSRAAGPGPAGDGDSLFPSASGNGRLVGFRSESTNLHPGDADNLRDVFVRDLDSGAVTLVSRASGTAGAKGDGHSYNPRVSRSGRYVAFRSNATNLHPDDADKEADVYVRDLLAGTTTLVSRATGPAGAKGDGGSYNPSISGDGSRVAFRSESTNLDPADTDTIPDVYVRDLRSGVTSLVSRASGPTGAKSDAVSAFPAISADGRRVAFRSEGRNLDPADTDTGADGRDIYVRDIPRAETILVSRAAGPAGADGNARSTFTSISAEGRFVAFDSLATNLHPDDPDGKADVLLRDLQTSEVELVSRSPGIAGLKADSGSSEPSISADGRYVAFHSVAGNLDPADPDHALDVFVRDRQVGRTMLVSRGAAGNGDGVSAEPWISPNGRLVSFHSNATNLHPDDRNGVIDVFARRVPPLPRCLGRRATVVAAAGTVTRGTDGRDVIVGTAGDERIRSGGGRDRVCAGDGDDVVAAGGGADKVRAGGGDDRVRAGRGRDRAWGAKGADGTAGGRGRDRIKGGGGNDRLRGGRGADRLDGGSKRDRLDGQPGRDRLDGGRGRDRLAGGRGADRLDGGSSRDRCRGSGRGRERRCER